MLHALLLILAAAEHRASLAQVPFNTVNVKPELAQFCSQQLAVELSQREVRLITPREIAAMLGVERQKQLLGCSDSTNCMAELGNALGAGGLLVGDLGKLGDRFQLSLRVVNPNTGAPIASWSGAAEDESGLTALLADAADALARIMVKKPSRAWIVPTVLAAVLLGAAAGMHVVADANYKKLVTPTTSPIMDPAVADDLARSGTGLQIAGFVAYGAAAAAFALAAVLFALSDAPPAQPTAMLTPSGAVFGLVGRLP